MHISIMSQEKNLTFHLATTKSVIIICLACIMHANTPEHNKDVIMKSLSKPDGVVRVVFVTVALGRGVNNMRGVNTIIHYGAPQSIEDIITKRVGGVVDQANQQLPLCIGDPQTVHCGRIC